MKRSLSSLITDTNVREYKVREINVQNISESNSQARTKFESTAVPQNNPFTKAPHQASEHLPFAILIRYI